jgi:PRTRC genetic system ThiF family protein
MIIDTSFARAAVVLPKQHDRLKIYLVGAGGTGSYAAHHIARLAFELKETGRAVDLIIVDPDRVERGNIPRSNFSQAEIGRFKAQTLAERLTAAWGLEIGYVNEKLDYELHVKPNHDSHRQMTVFVGCVDNHLARREIHRSVEAAERYISNDAPNTWWIDGGNGKFSGQVLIGSTVKKCFAEDYFTSRAICKKLPAPSLLHPELLEIEKQIPARRNETARRLSCPELVRLGEQSLNVNSRVAVEINEMLTQFLLMNNLRRVAAYFDLESGTSRALYTTPETIAQAAAEAEEKKPRVSKTKKRQSNLDTQID